MPMMRGGIKLFFDEVASMVGLEEEGTCSTTALVGSRVVVGSGVVVGSSATVTAAGGEVPLSPGTVSLTSITSTSVGRALEMGEEEEGISLLLWWITLELSTSFLLPELPSLLMGSSSLGPSFPPLLREDEEALLHLATTHRSGECSSVPFVAIPQAPSRGIVLGGLRGREFKCS